MAPTVIAMRCEAPCLHGWSSLPCLSNKKKKRMQGNCAEYGKKGSKENYLLLENFHFRFTNPNMGQVSWSWWLCEGEGDHSAPLRHGDAK
ncbi:hypothetical protein POVWA1_005670 [Plasmodium ovale wallikeri]|uniref:Uncharacterized protein n=1 Tax=Plasmodium ovale wallikeri TaxID=864142 RepID=A0A1A8YHW1_PLAOA|nr:hypothetical protein POVWA1_005670 [Plasmodium ovale wallikeri]